MSSAVDPRPIHPSDVDALRAQDAARALSHLATQGKAVRIAAVGQMSMQAFVLPDAAARVLLDALGHLAAGRAVTVVPVEADLTTQQAADLLNVSRPFLVGLLEAGRLPFHKVGTHRRVRRDDLLAFKHREQDARRGALNELAQQGQELGMGY